MLYDVLVLQNGQVVAFEQVRGFDKAFEIQEYYAQSAGYEVQIEPNVYAYIVEHHPKLKSNVPH